MCQSGAVQSPPPIIYTRQKLYFEFSSGRFDIHPNFHLSSTEVGFWIFYFFKEAPRYQTGSCLVFFCVQRATISVSKSSPGQRQHRDFLHWAAPNVPTVNPRLHGIPGSCQDILLMDHMASSRPSQLELWHPAFMQVCRYNREVRTSHWRQRLRARRKSSSGHQSLDRGVLTAGPPENFLCGHRQAMGCSLSQFTPGGADKIKLFVTGSHNGCLTYVNVPTVEESAAGGVAVSGSCQAGMSLGQPSERWAHPGLFKCKSRTLWKDCVPNHAPVTAPASICP